MYRMTYQKEKPLVIDGKIENTLSNRERLRKKREKECFPIVNRGQLWYNKLSTEQYSELVNWYNEWLNVTETLIIPVAPTWLNDKLEEEIIL